MYLKNNITTSSKKTSSQILQIDSHQYMSDDSNIQEKEKPLQNPSLAIHDDSLDQINVKIEKIEENK